MKIVKRILLGLLGLIVAILLFVVGSIFVDGFFAKGRLDSLTNTEISAADGTTIRAYLAKPTTPGPHPAVIMIHEFYGLRSEILGKADALAKEGYVVIAPNVYRTGTTNWIPAAVYKMLSSDTAQIDGDVEATFQWLVTQQDVSAGCHRGLLWATYHRSRQAEVDFGSAAGHLWRRGCNDPCRSGGSIAKRAGRSWHQERDQGL